MSGGGVDDQGNSWSSVAELWEEMTRPGEDGSPAPWYRKAVAYWSQQEASNKGVLGGFDDLNSADITDSSEFVLKYMTSHIKGARKNKQPLVALDCGAGIGRVSKELLLHHFQEVDLVEPCAHLLLQARMVLPLAPHWQSHGFGTAPGPPSEPALDPEPEPERERKRKRDHPAAHGAVGFFRAGLEDFAPEPGRYDLIWIQWALLYLTDDDLLSWLARCRKALRPGGFIMAKENVSDKQFVVDTEDLSITRTQKHLLELFQRAGFRLAGSAVQRNFPKGLYKVKMFALQAKADAVHA